MRLPPEHGADRRGRLKRELLRLALVVILVDAAFIAGYSLLHLERAGGATRIGYAAVWTALTLVIVLRGLIRIRKLRGGAR